MSYSTPPLSYNAGIPAELASLIKYWRCGLQVTLSLAKRHDALSDKTTRGLLLKALERDRDARRADLEAHLSPASIARDQRVDRARLEAMVPSEEAAGAAGAAARPASPASAQQDPPSTPAAQAGRQSLDEPASARQSAGACTCLPLAQMLLHGSQHVASALNLREI